MILKKDKKNHIQLRNYEHQRIEILPFFPLFIGTINERMKNEKRKKKKRERDRDRN